MYIINLQAFISKSNVEMLAREDCWFKRKVREAIKIKTRPPTINQDQGFELPAIYSEILPLTRDRDRQTSGTSPLSSGSRNSQPDEVDVTFTKAWRSSNSRL